MTEVDDNTVWIGCERIADTPQPLHDSIVEICEICQAEVWLTSGLRREVRVYNNATEVHIRCLAHGLGDNFGRMSFTRSQVEILISEGMSVEEIAQMFAIIELTGATSPDDPKMADAMDEIAKRPGGELSQDFIARAFRIRAEIAMQISDRAN